MKKELNLTDQEKIEFLAGLEYSNIAYDIKLNKNWAKAFGSACSIGTVGAGLFTFLLTIIGGASLNSALGCFPISIACGAGLFGICSIPAIISSFQNNKSFKSISNGKISYKDYKQLVKSGEIEKWKNQFQKEIELKLMEIDGYTIEDYKAEVEDNIISEVEDLIADEKIKLDSAKIAEEVKKRIDEHNERQN